MLVQFNDIDEFVSELDRNGPDVESNIVRLTQVLKPSPGHRGDCLHVVVTTTADRQLIRFESCCGTTEEDHQAAWLTALGAEAIEEYVVDVCAERGLTVLPGEIVESPTNAQPLAA